MNTNDLNTALYEKMAAEQDKFRDWLKSQSPEEVLNHAYEYTIREDIVMAMEELELTDAQAQALLESPSPLADVYRYFEKLETGYMDVIREQHRSIPILPPMRENMGSWSSTGLPTMQISNARSPLKRRCGNTSTECISVTMRQRV